jgi:hypothetical protein
MMDATVMK